MLQDNYRCQKFMLTEKELSMLTGVKPSKKDTSSNSKILIVRHHYSNISNRKSTLGKHACLSSCVHFLDL